MKHLPRFGALLCLLLGGFLLSLTLIRAVQPRQPAGIYPIVYGDRYGLVCCAAYMVNEARQQANRVQVGLMQQEEEANLNLSASGRWKFANVQVSSQSDYRAYFVPTDGSDPMPLPPEVSEGWMAFWDGQEDTLYYFARRPATFESALFRISPSQPTPTRLSHYAFGLIRTFQEQPLPDTHFTPWVLLGISLNLLAIAALWRAWWEE